MSYSNNHNISALRASFHSDNSRLSPEPASRGDKMNDECEECGCTQWNVENDSFDHAFGVQRYESYLQCCECDATRPIPEQEY